MKKLYTVFINDELWTNVIDDMNSTKSWAVGGIIFLNKKKAQDFVRDIKKYESTIKAEIKEIEII